MNSNNNLLLTDNSKSNVILTISNFSDSNYYDI